MKKLISFNLLALFFIGLFSLSEIRTLNSSTLVPQKENPAACEASRKNRQKCNHWYEMTENPHPDACKSGRQNREQCWRWYHVAEEEPPPPPKPIVIHGINFEFNKYNILPSSYPILDKNLEGLKTKNYPAITIIGHTDSIGSIPYNQKLSEKRATSVKNYFVEKGYESGKITTEGRGKMEPVAPNTINGKDNPEGRYQNRRIEIHFK